MSDVRCGTDELAEHVRGLVDAAPPLTSSQAETVRGLLQVPHARQNFGQSYARRGLNPIS